MSLIDGEKLMDAFNDLYRRNDDIIQKQRGCLWLSLETLEQIISDQPEAHDCECIPISWIKTYVLSTGKAMLPFNAMINEWRRINGQQ